MCRNAESLCQKGFGQKISCYQLLKIIPRSHKKQSGRGGYPQDIHNFSLAALNKGSQFFNCVLQGRV